ncbi:MAG: trypsin-like serine protease [Actinomycetia bacterium]|nr:trypsin-like serine protease [Actinomycetes bacterium]
MRPKILATLVVFLLLASACGGGGDETATTTSTSEASDSTTSIPSTTVVDAGTEDEDFDITMVQGSVVKILAEGTFIDAEEGLQLNAAGLGSGFIISEEGLVVTNNHVVTGAALLQVWLDGESDPVNARILGVDECSDLAVIDLEGDGYTPLSFATESVSAGLEVIAAGYPVTGASDIAEVDYTLTAGIISSADAPSSSSWSSVDGVLEHDARIRGGNSGGPLVSREDGSVVGINFAGTDLHDQNFAISAVDAMPIIESLSAGDNVDSIGINGQAVWDDDIGLSGIWVASVQSGSPADDASIEAGDIITTLEGLSLATDGSMDDYCDIIRTKGADTTMSIEVLRFASDEFLEGQLNGDPLVQSFSFAEEFDEEVASTGTGSAADTYAEYVTITDDSGLISVSVPAEWNDTDGSANPDFGPSIYAAPNLTGFLDTWDTPGIIIESSPTRTVDDLDATLAEIDLTGSCVFEGVDVYEDPLYFGSLELWSDCGGTGAITVVLVAAPLDGNFLIRMFIQAIEPRDLVAADEALATFIANV